MKASALTLFSFPRFRRQEFELQKSLPQSEGDEVEEGLCVCRQYSATIPSKAEYRSLFQGRICRFLRISVEEFSQNATR